MTLARFAGPIAIIAAGLAAFGCSLKTNDTTDGGSPEAGSGTIGDQCTRIYEVLCAKAINTCAQPGFTLADCVNNGKQSCCVDQCGHAAISTDDAVTACAKAVAQESCNDIVNNAMPPACVGVPKLPK